MVTFYLEVVGIRPLRPSNDFGYKLLASLAGHPFISFISFYESLSQGRMVTFYLAVGDIHPLRPSNNLGSKLLACLA